jgi:putative membrane protein
MTIRPREFNIQVFIEVACCMLFSIVTFYLLESGQYLRYVTPRMRPYLNFTAITMLVWSCSGFGRLFVPQNRIRLAHCFVLAIPILLILLPHSPLSVSDLSYGLAKGNYAGFPVQNQWAGDAADYEDEFSDAVDAEGTEDGLSTYADDIDETLYGPPQYADMSKSAADLSGLDARARKITVSSGEFYQWIEELFINPDKYAGYSIRMTGFVFKDPEILRPGEFVPARLVMSCCVADLLPFGMICKYEKTEELKADSWVTAEGVIHITEENGYPEPQARITSVTPAEAVEGYIYPYY